MKCENFLYFSVIKTILLTICKFRITERHGKYHGVLEPIFFVLLYHNRRVAFHYYKLSEKVLINIEPNDCYYIYWNVINS